MDAHRHALKKSALIITAVWWGLSQAQTIGSLSADHPIVIDHLIHFSDAQARHIETRNTADATQAASRLDGASRLFGVSIDGYFKMRTILSSAKSKLDSLQNGHSAYMVSLPASTPASSVATSVEAYHRQQTTILQGVPSALKAQLSVADWTALQNCIRAELVGKIKVGGLTNVQ